MATYASAPAVKVDQVGQPSSEADRGAAFAWRSLQWKHIFWYLVLGLIVLAFNLDSFLRDMGTGDLEESWTGAIARQAGRLPASMVSSIEGLTGQTNEQLCAQALEVTLILLPIYFTLAIVQSLRLKSARFLIGSVVGLFAGVLFLPLMVWAPIVAAVVLNVLVAVVSFAAGLVEMVLQWLRLIILIGAKVIVLIGGVLLVVFGLRRLYLLKGWPRVLLYVIAASGFLAVVTGLAPLIVHAWDRLRTWVIRLIAPILDVLAPLFSLVQRLIITLQEWSVTLLHYLGTILTYLLLIALAILAILTAVTWVVAGVMLIVALPGALLVDQLRVAWLSGRNHQEAFKSSFSLGLAMALLLVVSAGNQGLITLFDGAYEVVWRVPANVEIASSLTSFWPESLERTILPYLSASQAPLFDAAVLVVAVCISCIGMARLRGNSAGGENASHRLYFLTIIKLALGAFVSVFVVVLLLWVATLSRDHE